MVAELIITGSVLTIVYFASKELYNMTRSLKIRTFSQGDVFKEPTCDMTQEEQTRAKVKRAFVQQQQQINSRALKRHAHDCEDPMTCTKPDCWKPIPDKIVKTSSIDIQADKVIRYRQRKERSLQHKKDMELLRFGLQKEEKSADE